MDEFNPNLWDKFQYTMLSGAGSLLGLSGFTGNRLLGSALGFLMWHTQRFRRELATQNVQDHLSAPNAPRLSDAHARAIARASFTQNARSFLDILLTHRFGAASPLLHIQNPDLTARLLADPRPILGATAHIGAWELLAALLGDFFPKPRISAIVVRRYPHYAVQTYIARQRESHGADMIGHRTVVTHVLRAWKQNGIVSFLVDHHALRSESITLPFMGEPAAVNIGPALLAVRAKAVVWPIFLLREDDHYLLCVDEPLDTADLTGSREEKVNQTAQFYTNAVEKMVRHYPTQWFWMHNRWKP